MRAGRTLPPAFCWIDFVMMFFTSTAQEYYFWTTQGITSHHPEHYSMPIYLGCIQHTI
jgi:hypothetical protein